MKNKEITDLAQEILIDITDNRLPLHNILLKASRLSLLLNIPENTKLFKEWAKYAEQNSFVVEVFKENIEAAKDKDIALSSANPDQYVISPLGNVFERQGLRNEAKTVVGYLSQYRTETYNFALDVFTKWQFGNISEKIFEKKRSRTEPILRKIFPDINQRLNAIEENMNNTNPESWKSAVVSCRTLMMDIADILNPATAPEDKDKFINRLKNFISPLILSKTKRNLMESFLEELKNRLEYTINITQGSAHQDRPLKEQAEDVILYTYLMIAELIEIYNQRQKIKN